MMKHRLKSSWHGIAILLVIILTVAVSLFISAKKTPDTIKKDQMDDQISIAVLLERLKLSKKWFLNNTAKNMLLNYEYDPISDSYKNDSNHVRQLGALFAITSLDRLFRDKTLVPLIEKSLAYYLKFKVEEKDFAFLNIDGEPNLAYNAFLILALLNTPDYPQKDQLLAKLGSGILNLQQQDGSYKIKSGLDYYPGEANLALMKLYQQTKNDQYLQSVEKSFNYYRNYWRNHKNTAFIPWHTQAYFILYQQTSNKELSDFILEMNDWLIDDQGFLTRFSGKSPDNSIASYLEGIIDTYSLAKTVSDNEREQRYKTAIDEGIKLIIKTQISYQQAINLPDPIRAAGGFTQSLNNKNQRVDYTQHAVSALIKALQMLTVNEI